MLECPFCRRPLDEPQEITSRFGNTFSGGRCECGAVYVYDQSGHNLGDAYVDALGFSCNDDLEKAWKLLPGEDYEVIELSYDARRNRFVREITSRGRRTPVYLFLLVKNKGEDEQHGKNN